jgi:predicted nucleic acid-binding protein
MEWVFDASVTMAWCFDDGRTNETDALFRRLATSAAVVPQLWPLEVANVLALAVRKGRLTVAKRAQFIAVLDASPIHVDAETARNAFDRVLPLADAHQLTTYDATYLELAMRSGVPLATLDQQLRAAATAAGVPLL